MADYNTSIYWESVYKISRIWGDVLTFYVLLFGVVHLAWCDFAMDPTKDCTWQWLDKRSGKEAWGETYEEQIQEHVYHFLWYQAECSQRIRPGRPNSQFRITVTFYGDWVKMCDDFTQIFGDKRTDCYITMKHSLTLPSSPGNLLPKTTWLSSPHTLLFCFSDWR
jgi:hypothetical protein